MIACLARNELLCVVKSHLAGMSQREQHSQSSSSTLTHQQRYHGLLKRSILKNIRDDLFSFFDYIHTMAPSLQGPVVAMRVVNTFQLIMSFFYQFDARMWPKETVTGKIIGVLSIGSVLCPTTASLDIFGEVFITII